MEVEAYTKPRDWKSQWSIQTLVEVSNARASPFAGGVSLMLRMMTFFWPLILKPLVNKPELEPTPRMDLLLPMLITPHPLMRPLILMIAAVVPETADFKLAQSVTVTAAALPPPVVPPLRVA